MVALLSVVSAICVGLLFALAHFKMLADKQKETEDKLNELRATCRMINDSEVNSELKLVQKQYRSVDFDDIQPQEQEEVASYLYARLNQRIDFIEQTKNSLAVKENILRIMDRWMPAIKSRNLVTRIETLLRVRREIDNYYFGLFKVDGEP